jgi:ammonia channel protein AmtB
MDKADLAWVGVSTLLVVLMVLPGLALFYGGLVRSKNVLSILMQVLTTFSLAVVLWFIYGYSIAFSDGNAFFGGFSKVFFSGMFTPADGTYAMSGTRFGSRLLIYRFVIWFGFQAILQKAISLPKVRLILLVVQWFTLTQV